MNQYPMNNGTWPSIAGNNITGLQPTPNVSSLASAVVELELSNSRLEALTARAQDAADAYFGAAPAKDNSQPVTSPSGSYTRLLDQVARMNRTLDYLSLQVDRLTCI